MKLVIAIIKPQQLDAVRAGLSAIGVDGMTVTDVRGFGRQRGQKEVYRGAEYNIDFVPKLKIEVAMPAERVDEALGAIRDAAHTGSIGDGKLFVLDLEQAVRVRTGETGPGAL